MATIYVATTGNDSTGDGSIGNPYATPGKAGSVKASGDKVYIKAGTYTLATSTANVAGGRISDTTGGSDGANFSFWEGYSVTPGDLAATPVISAGAITSITIGSFSANFTQVRNIKFDGNSGASNTGIAMAAAVHTLFRVQAANCPSTGIDMSSASQSNIGFCLADTCGIGLKCSTGQDSQVPYGCVARNCSSHGIQAIYANRCLSYGNGACGFFLPAGVEQSRWWGCTAYGNTSDGFGTSDGPNNGWVVDCVAVSNGGWGFNNLRGSSLFSYLVNCAGYNNTSGDKNANYNAVGFITLSGNPFTNAGAGDFSLNNTAGAGAALRAAASLGIFPGGLTTGYLDIGAAQHQDSGGGGGGAPKSVYAGGRRYIA